MSKTQLSARPVARRFLAGAATLVLSCGALAIAVPSARADDKEACASSYEHAQKLKRDGKLKDARAELVLCGSEKCPALLVPYCVQMLKEVDESLPTLIVAAHGPKGEQVDAVRVIIDGAVVTEKLDGRPIPTDPGKHHLRYELAGSSPVEEDIIVNEGEHARRLEPSFGGPRPSGASTGSPSAPVNQPGPPPSKTTSPGPGKVPGFVLIGVGGAGIISGAVLGGLALSAKSSLDSACKPKNNCPASSQGDIDKLNTFGIGSTVGFSVGGAAAVVGIILAAALPSKSASPTATGAVRVEPWVSPFGGGVRGAF